MLNSIVVVGRLTKDPDAPKTQETEVAKFSVAVNSGKNKNGEEETSFLDVVAFKGVASSCLKSLRKGSKVAVKGSLRVRKFTRKDGSDGTAVEILADSVEFLDPKPQGDAAPSEEQEKPKFDPYTGKPLTGDNGAK